MSKRNRDKRKRAKKKKQELAPTEYFDDKRDGFYGAVLGAAITGLVSVGFLGFWNTFTAFAVGYFFWFGILFFLHIPKKPIRLTSKAFEIGLAVGSTSFLLLVGILYLVLG